MMLVKAGLIISNLNWCVWIVLECGFYVKPLFGFQFLRDCSMFLQIQSHAYKKSNEKFVGFNLSV